MLTSERRIDHEETSIVAERKHIARDLHDGVTQQFAHVLHKLEFLERLLEAQEWQSSASSRQIVLDEIQRTYALQKAGLDELRTHIVSLSVGTRLIASTPDLSGEIVQSHNTPMTPTSVSLRESVGSEDVGEQGVMNITPTKIPSPLAALVQAFREQNPQVELSYIDEHTHHLTTALIVPIYRIVQEALNNVQKHAQASHVTVHILVFPHKCIVEITDDGIGFHIPLNTAPLSASVGTENTATTIIHNQTRHNGLGLHIMRERVQEAGGSWELYSTPGKGTTIRARFLAPFLPHL